MNPNGQISMDDTDNQNETTANLHIGTGGGGAGGATTWDARGAACACFGTGIVCPSLEYAGFVTGSGCGTTISA
jgi:hypothetical protein